MNVMSISCKISSGEYARILFGIFFSEQWIWFVLPLLLFAALSIVDIRFIIVALMVLFIVIPMVISMLYFNYLLTVETRWSIVDKKIKAEKGKLFIEFEDGKSSPITIDKEEVSSVIVRSQYLLIELSVRRYQYLVVPVSAFDNKKQQEEFLAALS